MPRALAHRLRPLALLAAVAVLVAVAGCWNPFSPRIAAQRSISEPPPIPNSPKNLMLLFKWAWENQDISVYEELFTDDYRFAFAAADSVGNPPLTRDDEIQVGRNLFVEGTATEPRANRITLDYVSELVARPDRRPGKTDPWHKEMLINVVLKVYTDDLVHQVDGRALFFVVRGDSAQIPTDLRQRGFGPDSTRWYIERWEDQTDAGSLSAPQVETTAAPAAVKPERVASPEPLGDVQTTWGVLKLSYLGR